MLLWFQLLWSRSSSCTVHMAQWILTTCQVVGGFVKAKFCLCQNTRGASRSSPVCAMWSQNTLVEGQRWSEVGPWLGTYNLQGDNCVSAATANSVRISSITPGGAHQSTHLCETYSSTCRFSTCQQYVWTLKYFIHKRKSVSTEKFVTIKKKLRPIRRCPFLPRLVVPLILEASFRKLPRSEETFPGGKQYMATMNTCQHTYISSTVSLYSALLSLLYSEAPPVTLEKRLKHSPAVQVIALYQQ